MHSLQVNLERPFGDVSGLEKQWCVPDEVPYVSNCHQRTIYGDNDTMLVDCDPCGSSRGVVNNRNCDSGFGKGKATCSGGNIALFFIVLLLHCTMVALLNLFSLHSGAASGNPTHGFRMYESTLFEPKGSTPCNSDPFSLHAYRLGNVHSNSVSTYTMCHT